MKCPYCSGDINKETATCSFCNSTFTSTELSQLENNIKGTYEYIKGNAEKERWMQAADAHLNMQNYFEALKIYERLSFEYPQDYRGWLGQVICKTEKYSLTDPMYSLNETKLQEIMNKALSAAPQDLHEGIKESWELFCSKRAQLKQTQANQEIQKVNANLENERKKVAQSFAEQLAQSTPTVKDLKFKQVQQHQEKLAETAQKAIGVFRKTCENYASNGAHSCWSYASSSVLSDRWEGWTYWIPTKHNQPKGYVCGWGFSSSLVISSEDAATFLSLLRNGISTLGFKNYSVEIADIKAVKDPYAMIKHKVVAARVFKISAWW